MIEQKLEGANLSNADLCSTKFWDKKFGVAESKYEFKISGYFEKLNLTF